MKENLRSFFRIVFDYDYLVEVDKRFLAVLDAFQLHSVLSALLVQLRQLSLPYPPAFARHAERDVVLLIEVREPAGSADDTELLAYEVAASLNAQWGEKLHEFVGEQASLQVHATDSTARSSAAPLHRSLPVAKAVPLELAQDRYYGCELQLKHEQKLISL